MTFNDIKRASIEPLLQQMLNSEMPAEKLRNLEQHTSNKHNLPTILICGHNSRDRRCGVLGPLLRDEFTSNLRGAAPHSPFKDGGNEDTKHHAYENVSVGLVSHIGGHAWAGNVIMYFPPGYVNENGLPSPLAAKGVWYGRVGPQHVEGIVNETLKKGIIIEELLRGVHGN